MGDYFDSLLETAIRLRKMKRSYQALKNAVEDVVAEEPYESPEGKIKLISYKREVFDVRAFKNEYPELYRRFTKEIQVKYVGVYPRGTG